MNKEDWGFLHNETKDGNISIPFGRAPVQHSVLLTGDESDLLNKMAQEMDLSTHSVLKQGLRVLQMYRAGYLIDNSPKSGGCSGE